MGDPVNHPQHYQGNGGIECIDFLDWTGDVVPFCLENAKKYLWRNPNKSNSIEDLEKALWYLEFAYRKRVKEPRWLQWFRLHWAWLHPPSIQDVDAVLDKAQIFHQRNVFKCLFMYRKTGHLLHLEYAMGQLHFEIHQALQTESAVHLAQALEELIEAS